jgi:hypothetical protein
MSETIFIEGQGICKICDSCGQPMEIGSEKVVEYGSETREVCQICVEMILQDALFEPETDPNKE